MWSEEFSFFVFLRFAFSFFLRFLSFFVSYPCFLCFSLLLLGQKQLRFIGKMGHATDHWNDFFQTGSSASSSNA